MLKQVWYQDHGKYISENCLENPSCLPAALNSAVCVCTSDIELFCQQELATCQGAWARPSQNLSPLLSAWQTGNGLAGFSDLYQSEDTAHVPKNARATAKDPGHVRAPGDPNMSFVRGVSFSLAQSCNGNMKGIAIGHQRAHAGSASRQLKIKNLAAQIPCDKV